MVAEAVLPSPPFASDVSSDVSQHPLPSVAVTFTLNVHEAPAANVAPTRLMLPLPGVAVMIPPPHGPVTSFSVATTRPSGSVSVKPTPVSATVAFGLLMVAQAAEPPSGIDTAGIDAAVRNDLLIVGGATTAATTTTDAVEVLPVPPLVDITVTLLVLRPQLSRSR